MFDFSRANEAQREAIQVTDGPVLITAGPGTGKTFTLVQRALYLIMEKVLMPVIFIQEFMDVSIANMEMLMASTGKMKYLEVQP